MKLIFYGSHLKRDHVYTLGFFTGLGIGAFVIFVVVVLFLNV